MKTFHYFLLTSSLLVFKAWSMEREQLAMLRDSSRLVSVSLESQNNTVHFPANQDTYSVYKDESVIIDNESCIESFCKNILQCLTCCCTSKETSNDIDEMTVNYSDIDYLPYRQFTSESVRKK